MAENNNPSEMGKRGGKARAEKLTAEERSSIARQAAAKRWNKDEPLRAVLDGSIELSGGISMACAVLEDGMRVLSQRGFAEAMGGSKPSSRTRRGAGKLPAFMSAANLKPFIPNDLEAPANYVEYLPRHGGRTAFGIRAEAIARMLQVWVDADDAGALKHTQKHLAVKARILLRALAGVAITALVDEATGYQDIRARDALAKILEAYVATELRRWVPTFPTSFFREICRIKGIEFRSDMRLPPYFGHIINDLVYSRLAPGVLDELRQKNPRLPSGRRRDKHFQWLTDDVGNPHLLHHLGMIEGIAGAFDPGEWSEFYARINKRLPRHTPMPLFDQLEDD